MKTRFSLSTLALGLLLTGAASAEQPGPPDTAVGRLTALAIVNALNADLLSHDSATLTLDRWCATHKLAPTPKVVAHLEPGAEKPADAGVRKLLGVTDAEPVKYRRVKLMCGDHILSEADNWYVPSRLTESMNHVLETTDTAFGRAVQELHFQRHTVSAELLWQPLPADWDMGGALPPSTSGNLAIPEFVLQHRAYLTRGDGVPFSVVVESYTREVLSFPWPTIGR
ncbi:MULTISPECIES: hypothetical protein [unclassified Rhizobium]|uniref:hypothetical protein n=1 Tax=unclassified Rhizobium TaxID=2613769 RepID=UPI001ADC2438|nr:MULTISPECIES: hypothetical protein [unclassified Rhizobium]MBO9098524.1 hypothetical protein [Rhizobium sp. L58/93]MBO9132670.1 hypothetical protein [Rhizobium sp. B209b/85]MBO9168790.1 hypothetical protein [Rhizobium sp. L245/93]MBO9184740.1 hypothetical protein [Rhizobium sp. E27B/91]QXZ84919.1 hypothetical protein J5287_05100 [Rhizobium sp. K1/93]